ncbi:MAG: DUF423 domain-containing protein [Verrucomicrobiota bacterium]
METAERAWRLVGVVGFLGVALGAFGAHGLAPLLQAHEQVANWKTATLYHLVHAAVLAAVAAGRPRFLVACQWFFGMGILIFSGTLYLMGVTGWRWLGAITPVGGLLLLVGWGLLLASGWRKRVSA